MIWGEKLAFRTQEEPYRVTDGDLQNSTFNSVLGSSNSQKGVLNNLGKQFIFTP